MVRRRAAVALVAVLVLVGVGVLAVRQLERNQVEDVGGVAVAIEGRDIDLWPFNAELEGGVGVGGRLGLVKGRCLGIR